MNRAEKYQELFNALLDSDRAFLRSVVSITPANYASIAGAAKRIKENREFLAVCLDSLIDNQKERGE